MAEATPPPAGDRIVFAGSPWPEGHPVAEFEWTAFRRDGAVWFGFHLKTARYDAERAIEDEGVEYASDWEAPIVWTNYHACTLSTSKWHDGGFRVGPALDLDALDGLELVVDSPPPEDTEDNACHVYLLGHDAVADHRIRFARIPGTDAFDIAWSGRLALVYSGDEAYRHAFTARLRAKPAPALPRRR